MALASATVTLVIYARKKLLRGSGCHDEPSRHTNKTGMGSVLTSFIAPIDCKGGSEIYGRTALSKLNVYAVDVESERSIGFTGIMVIEHVCDPIGPKRCYRRTVPRPRNHDSPNSESAKHRWSARIRGAEVFSTREGLARQRFRQEVDDEISQPARAQGCAGDS